MNEEEQPNTQSTNDSEIEEKEKKLMDLSKIWNFCPSCGDKIPKNKKFRYCMDCGLDLIYLVEHKEFPPEDPNRIKKTEYPPYEIPYDEIFNQGSYPSPHYKSYSYAYKKRRVRKSNAQDRADLSFVARAV